PRGASGPLEVGVPRADGCAPAGRQTDPPPRARSVARGSLDECVEIELPPPQVTGGDGERRQRDGDHHRKLAARGEDPEGEGEEARAPRVRRENAHDPTELLRRLAVRDAYERSPRPREQVEDL